MCLNKQDFEHTSGPKYLKLWNYGTLINILSKTQEKEVPQGNNLEVFLLDTFETIF